MAREVKEFFAADFPDLVTVHILDFYQPGIKDSRWLKALEEDRSWIVLTQDLGNKGPRNEKLPLICKELGISFVCFTPFIIKAGYTIQKRSIVAKWDEILKLRDLPRGSRGQLTGHIAKDGSHRFELRITENVIPSV